MSEQLKLSISTLLTIIVVVAAICAAFYTANASSRSYTDEQVRFIQTDIADNNKCFQKELGTINVKMAVVEQILVERFGRPQSLK